MSANNDLKARALNYHKSPVPGKIEVISTKNCQTQDDLSLAYTPGVAIPCMEIHENSENAYDYTSKGNLVAVVTNGTAVLGLGNIGALAGKPVMEGKGILFKKFADIDVFDIELNSANPEEIINACKMLEPTFGGINLEDIKAPECFIIEEELKKSLNIPVFHDDQHGTAIVGGAALINALKVAGKKIEDIKVVMNGAGASGLAIASLIMNLGVKKENLILCDTQGVIYKGRPNGMNEYKEKFATDKQCKTLAEAVAGADVLYGLSKKGAFTSDMIKSMAENPIIFAMANPDPEITPEEVKKIRDDAIMATGRSDYPNQINNVMCFPFIFRGALDVRTTVINEEMKMAAAYAIADLAHKPVPEEVRQAYNGRDFVFGKEYILPTPFDPRLLTEVSAAVAQAAIKSGVAKKKIDNILMYKLSLEERLNPAKKYISKALNSVKKKDIKIGFSHAEVPAVLIAAKKFQEYNIGMPYLIGNESDIKSTASNLNIDISGMVICDPENYKGIDNIIDNHYKTYWRMGLSLEKAKSEIKDNYNRFGATLLEKKEISGLIAYTDKLSNTLSEVADVIDLKDDYVSASTATLLSSKYKDIIVADTSFYADDDSHLLAEVIFQTIDTCKSLNITPNIAVISNGSFGKSIDSDVIYDAINIVKDKDDSVLIEGDLDLETAFTPSLLKKYPLSKADGNPNVLIFSNIQAADIMVKSLTSFGGFKVCGKVIQGFSAPIEIAEDFLASDDIFNLSVLVASKVK